MKNETIVFKGNIFEVVQWEGKPGKVFEAAVRAPGVRLIIETEIDGKQGLVMTREVRQEVGEDIRLPGGKVFDTLDEFSGYRGNDEGMRTAALRAAHRESREEVGVIAGDFEYITTSRAGSSVEWDLYYFKVVNAEIAQQELEEHEVGDITVVHMSAEDIFNALTAGKIQEGRSAEILWKWLFEKGFIIFN